MLERLHLGELTKRSAVHIQRRACQRDGVEIGFQVLQVQGEVEDVDVGKGLRHLQSAAAGSVRQDVTELMQSQARLKKGMRCPQDRERDREMDGMETRVEHVWGRWLAMMRLKQAGCCKQLMTSS